jgi:stage V sporulation protein D (sporulation-specific penicillin-binding protein)
VIIIVDEPTKGTLYGSTVAAPYVANVLETILPYLGVEAVYSEAELEKMTVSVPNCLYWSRSAAENYCKNLGLSVEFIGDEESNVVQAQYPLPETVIEKSSGRVVFYVGRDYEEATVTVPDVTGMSAAAANQTLIQSGLNIRILGTKNYLSGTGAIAISQSVAAGSQVPRGSVIEVTFRYLSDVDFDHNG